MSLDNTNCVRIKKIHIDKFRRFNNVELCFGDKITLICGRNCTSKSTALGLLCQPLTFGEHKNNKKSVYLDAYHNFDLTEFKTLTGIPFKRNPFDIFRISQIYDKPKELLYHIFFEGKSVNTDCKNLKDGLRVRSEPRSKIKNRKLRFITGRTHNAGEGNFPHPLIYLGLERLYPLASCQSVELNEVDERITNKDKEWCEKHYNEILLLNEYNGMTESVHVEKGHRKIYLGHKTNDYDSEGCSAGQDNVGQILTAILSFKHLKENLGDKYRGGVIIIDEIDATLHPQAQEHLLRLLKIACEDYSLQIIATTHSLYMLNLATKSELSQDIEVIHLERIADKVICKNNITYEMVSDFLKVKVTKYKSKEKTVVLLEDPIAVWMFRHIVGNALDNYIHVPEFHISGYLLIAQSSFEVKCFKETLCIIDADLAGNMPQKKRNNLLALPGTFAPEKELFFLLDELPEDDKFWMSLPYPTYTKSVCFKNYSSHGKTKTIATGKNRESDIAEYKKWFTEQRDYWANNGEDVISMWREKNQSQCRDFCVNLINSLERIRCEKMPDSIKNKIFSKFISFEETLGVDSKTQPNTDIRISGNHRSDISKPLQPKQKSKTSKIKDSESDISEKDQNWRIIQPEFGF